MLGGMTLAGYSVSDAAKLLEVSPRRVRQLHATGVLPSVPGERAEGSPLVLDPEAVNRERDRRKQARKDSQKPAGSPGGTSAGVDTDTLLAVVDSVTARALDMVRAERAEVLAIRDRTEEALRQEVAEERARRMTAEARLEDLRAELEAMRAKAAQAIAAPVVEVVESPPVEPAPSPPAPAAQGQDSRPFWRRIIG